MLSPPAPARRHVAGLLAGIVALLGVLATFATPAAAAPDPDGSGGSLMSQLEAAATGYLDAKVKLEASRKRQVELDQEQKVVEVRLKDLYNTVGTISAAAYRGRRASLTAGVLDAKSPEGLLHAAATMHYLTWRDDQELHKLVTAKDSYLATREAIANEIRAQEQQVAEMTKRKADLEKALNYSAPTGGFPVGPPTAAQAPRNPDGSWPAQTCSVPDPTTTGCLTPRMLHALTEARKAGYTRYAACFRGGTFGEHPLGRACDLAAAPNGFGPVAYGADKEYGDRLAAWILSNKDRLGVLYVIWYKQVWFEGTGWRGYSGDGSPAGDHTNHVHLSMR